MKGDRVNSTERQCSKVIPSYFRLTPDTPKGSRNSVTRFCSRGQVKNFTRIFVLDTRKHPPDARSNIIREQTGYQV